jgi:hypothetical protein
MLRTLLGLGLLATALSGCTYLSATPSVQGHAYLVRDEWVASSFWNCDATGPEPVCYQTKKQFTQQPAPAK